MISEGSYIAVDHDKVSLEHHGVLGMKWGVRKDGKPQGFQYGKGGGKSSGPSRRTQRAAAKKAASAEKARKADDKLREDALKSHDPEVVAKGMHLLTDEELGMKIKRLTEEHRIDSIRYENKQRQLAIAQQSKTGKSIAEKYGDAVVNRIIQESARSTVNAGKALGGLGFEYARTVSGNPRALDNLTPEKFAGDFSRQMDFQNLSQKERNKIIAERFKNG